MRVMITGRHVAVTPALRRYIETRMKRLERFGGKLGNAQVVVGVEKYRHIAEASLNLNGVPIQGKVSTNEMYASVDQLIDKISRQVQKRKEKLADHKGGTILPPRRERLRPGPALPQVTVVPAALQTLTLRAAVECFQGDPGPLLIFLNSESNKIQVLRRVGRGGFELIDPQPPSSKGG